MVGRRSSRAGICRWKDGEGWEVSWEEIGIVIEAGRRSLGLVAWKWGVWLEAIDLFRVPIYSCSMGELSAFGEMK